MEPLSKRVEVTLKMESDSSAQKTSVNGLSSLRVGDMVSGRIKRIESYGLFVTIDQTNLVCEYLPASVCTSKSLCLGNFC